MSFGSKRHTLLEANWRIKTGYTQESAYKTGAATRRCFMSFAPQGRVSEVTIEQAVSICRPQGRRPSPLPTSTSGPPTGKKGLYGTPRKKPAADCLLYPSTTSSPQGLSPWHNQLDNRLCKRVLSHQQCSVTGFTPAASPSAGGGSTVRSTGGSPKNVDDHYAYLLMQLCQQHRKRRSRQMQSASLPGSPASTATRAATSLSGAAGGTAACVAAAGTTGYTAACCSGSAAGRCCTPLPTASAAAACERRAVDEEHKRMTTQGTCFSSSETCCCAAAQTTAQHSFRNSRHNNSSSSSTKKEMCRDVAEAYRRQGEAENDDSFVLGTPRHQQQMQQQSPQQHIHQQQRRQQQQGNARVVMVETRVSRTRFTQQGNETEATAAAADLLQQEMKNSPPLPLNTSSSKPPVCGPQCTCSSTCSNPCGRTITTTTTTTTTLRSPPGISSPIKASVDVMTRSGEGMLQKQGCSSSGSRHGLQATSDGSGGGVATAEDEENELEYYICSAADDIVGRYYCEKAAYMWEEEASAAVFESNQQEVDVQGGQAVVKTAAGAAYKSQKRSDAQEVWGLKGAAKSLESRQRKATTERKKQQQSEKGGTTRENKAIAAAYSATGGVKVGKREPREEFMSGTQFADEIPSEGACAYEHQHQRVFSRSQQQEGIWKSCSIYDNELEMYEHRNTDVRIRKYKASSTSKATATTTPRAAAALYASPSGVYQESRQPESCTEGETNVPGIAAVASKQLNTCLSSFYSCRPPLIAAAAAGAAAGAKGKVGRTPAAASSSSSSRSLSASSSSSRGLQQVEAKISTRSGSRGKSSVASSSSSSRSFSAAAVEKQCVSSSILPSSSSSAAAGRTGGSPREAVEGTGPAADNECIQQLSETHEKRLELDRDVPTSNASAFIPVGESSGRGTAGCSSFFPCVLPQQKKMTFSRPSSQSRSVSSTAKQAVRRSSSSGTPCSAAAPPDSLDTSHLQAEKIFRPEAAAQAPPEAASLSVTAGVISPTKEAATEEEAALPPSTAEYPPPASSRPHPQSAAATASHNGAAAEYVNYSQTEGQNDNELDIYLYKTEHSCLQNTENALFLQGGSYTGSPTKLRSSRKGENSQIDALEAAAAYTFARTPPNSSGSSSSSSLSLPAGCNNYRNQDAYASSQQQDCMARNVYTAAAAAGRQEKTTKSTAKGEENVETRGRCCLPVPDTTTQAISGAYMSPQHCCCDSSQADKQWLLQQKTWGACKACGVYGEVTATAGSQNSCGNHRISEEKRASNHQIPTTPRRQYDMTKNSPPPVVWLLPRDDETAGEGLYYPNGDIIQRPPPQQQQQHHQTHGGKEQRNACSPHQNLREMEDTHNALILQQEEGIHDRPPPPSQQQGRAEERQRLAAQQQQQQQSPRSSLKQHQRQWGRRQQEQQPTEPAGQSCSVTCNKRQHLEEVFPTGRQDWHVAAYEDAVELKKKRQHLHNARSQSCGSRSSREKQAATGGKTEVVVTDHYADEKGQAYKEEATRATPVTSNVAFAEIHDASYSCFSGDVKGTTRRQQQAQRFQQQVSTQQQPYTEDGQRRVLLQHEQQQRHSEMLLHSREGQQHHQLVASTLQDQGWRVDANEQYTVNEQQQHQQQWQQQRWQRQERTQESRQQKVLRQPQEKEEGENKGTNEAEVAYCYPMHTYRHLKQSGGGKAFPSQNNSSIPPPKETASPPPSSSSWKCGKAEADWNGEVRGDAQLLAENSRQRQQQEDLYRSCSPSCGGMKVSRNACESTHIDSCRIQGGTNRNSATHSFLSVTETLVYDKQVPQDRSFPVLPSSLAVSPASPSEQEAYPPLSLYGHRQPATHDGVMENQQDSQEKQSQASDTHCNTWLMQTVDCCREKKQQQDQQHQHQQLQQQQQQQRQQQQPQQQRGLRKQEQEQQPPECGGKYRRDANQVDQREREKQMADKEKNKSPRPAKVTLKCTCPVTPTYLEKTDAVGRSYC